MVQVTGGMEKMAERHAARPYLEVRLQVSKSLSWAMIIVLSES